MDDDLRSRWMSEVKDGAEIVGYHVREGVSLWNHHIMACLEHVPADRLHPDNAVCRAEAQWYLDEGFPYVCDECEEMLLDG